MRMAAGYQGVSEGCCLEIRTALTLLLVHSLSSVARTQFIVGERGEMEAVLIRSRLELVAQCYFQSLWGWA